MDMRPETPIEARRLELQQNLDAAKTQAERNRMGQFATPTALARDILGYAKRELDADTKVRFLDPAIGTGSFYSALLEVFPEECIDAAVGYEIDPHYATPAAALWQSTGLDVRQADFTHAPAPPPADAFNLLICNPPYVRHHHIVNGDKHRLRQLTRSACGLELSGLAGLYCYFLGLSHQWMADGGLAGWLIPSEFMDVNYGLAIKQYLLDTVNLLHIHRFDPNDVQFGDALVSSAVVWFRKAPPNSSHEVRFTYGGSLTCPTIERSVPTAALRRDRKWTRYPKADTSAIADAPVLSDYFTIKRGLATGDNSYFILSAEELESRKLPYEAFRPILPSPRYVSDDEIPADSDGNPLLERRLYLLDCRLTESDIKVRHPPLWEYLEEGKSRSVAQRYICRHRKPWYAQENRPAAPLVCTYLGRSDTKRGRPFRFILNNSRATAANVYLMLYPKPQLAKAAAKRPALMRQVWEYLNAIRPADLLGEGRVYGGGLHKLEPKELGNVPVEGLTELAGLLPPRSTGKQAEMFELAQ
ncbi:MAG: SAM-dependent DNA methyltransferase [Gammaproteobacteria bacterium]|nr:SAM-dependent DNA methyltransferase [Gammaproteobacteria bacterium]MYE52084.1 SAM-dependent DNA methyltransferase [Gammaproteobacteria bacterium]MYF51065.1 SAM-dependent DNA methyltransferase [Gammaproteobacteria bacterium]MYH16560.1 SAM-dependent DNA methyltransferase [Gammaproteobacteria bacterium]MYK83437.1 SAM-dependent DNA methyltransferase [Gammaproteobacteria bacterium]